jgi:translation initiation factor eIF-2B subunit delta
MYRLALEKAKEKVSNFKIIYVDVYGRDSSMITNNIVYKELEFFSNLGIEVTYTYLNGVSALISKVTKVFILARCMFSNGFLLGNNGASMIACLAYNFKKPVIAICETFKFSEKSQMDSYLYNNIIIEKNQNKITNNNARTNDDSVNYLIMQYDLTPSNYINMIICELGYLPTTSVPVVLREFGKTNELDEKELNYELK